MHTDRWGHVVKRVVAIRGWARGRAGLMRVDGPFTTILFDGEDLLYYYDPENTVDSEDDFSDFVILIRTESRQPTDST